MSAPVLHVSLDHPLPDEVTVGAGTALFVTGACYCPRAPLLGLELLVDGVARPVSAFGMPRLDFFRELHPRLDPFDPAAARGDPSSPDDPECRGYASGFWGHAVLTPRAADGSVALALRARLRGGEKVVAELGTVLARAVVGRLEVPVTAATPVAAGIAICMATYHPPIELFRRQVESIRAQTRSDWVCYLSDDASAPAAFSALQEVIGDDHRFVVSRSERRLGFYGNFERALQMAPDDTELIALADQDDAWDPDKLATLSSALGDAELVYSDARIVSRDGRRVAGTYWGARRNNHSDVTSLLVANAVTGAASLMRRRVVDRALPFPPAQFAHYHDHWLGLCARSLGRIAYVDRPLYDYVQHGEASLGHEAANRMTALSERVLRPRRPRERIRMWRMHYFVDICRLQQFAIILLLRGRGSGGMDADAQAALRRFLRADDAVAPLAWLAGRGLREVLGAAEPETLGAEWMLACGLLWRRLLDRSARPLPQRRGRLDAVPPPELAPRAGQVGLDSAIRAVVDKIEPLSCAVSAEAPERVNILIPTIDVAHFFGGYIAKFNLAAALARRGVRVRIVTVDPTGPLPPGWRAGVESYSGLTGLFDRVEVAFARGAPPLEVSPRDRFVATTWWTAHIADRLREAVGSGPFLYLIQEYEPYTFPMGSYAALAARSYEFEHFALFSSELLRQHFRRERIGVFAAAPGRGERRSASFQNAITPVSPLTSPQLRERHSRRLLVYARAEPHAARNMYELAMLGLSALAREGELAGWEINGIGSVSGERWVGLGGGAGLSLRARSSQASYGELLRAHDVGLALMYTPHPSLVPIEMASAGLVTVTNSFGVKTPEAMASISSNLVTVAPNVEAIVGGLRTAVARAEDAQGRVAGSEVAWSSDWAESFADELVDQVLAWLRGERDLHAERVGPPARP